MKKQYEGLDAVLIPINSGECIATSGEQCFVEVTLQVGSGSICTTPGEKEQYEFVLNTLEDWCKHHPEHTLHNEFCE